jgi:hypothetical protein
MGEGNRTRSFIILFFILTLAFSLTSAGILKGNMAIGMDAYATKSERSSGGGSKGGGDSSGSSGGGGSSDESREGSSGGSGETGRNDNPTTEEPNPPPTCEQGSASPECSNVPESPPPPPPGPIDCSTTPNDPSCKTTPGGPIDCNTNPNDLSCGPQPPVDCKTKPDDPSCTTLPPVDCKTTPNDPSCKPDCTKNPDDPSCKVDCTANPSDPSCPPTPPCQSAVIGMSCPPVDCTKNPDDPSCPPIHIDCAQKQGFTVRIVDGKCVYDPIKCPQGEQLVNNKCSPSGPDESCLFHPEQDKCKPDQNGNCPNGFFLNDDEHCVPDKPCPKGFEHHAQDETGACYPIKKPPCQADGSRSDVNGTCPTSKTLSLSIAVAKDPIVRGHEQTITVKVSDENSHQRISSANVQGNVRYASGSTDNGDKFSGSTDNNGVVSYTWPISGNAVPGKFTANVQASKEGYKSASGTKSFTVKPATDHQVGGGGGGYNQGARSSTIQQIKYFREFSDMPPNSPIYITNTSMHKDVLNDIVITGEVKNRGTNTANFVELIATFYNINNQTVGNENTFTKPSTLQPGQAAPFTMYLSPKDMPLGQIKSVKYHLSWNYEVSSSTSSPTSPSHASKTLLPNTSS